MMDKPIKLYNTQSGVKEEFLPADPQDVRIYCCGPTVHDEPHLGNIRTFIFSDSLKRCLQNYKNYNVRYVMNITDYDDKIISKGGLNVARAYENIFFDTMDKLNIQRPDFTPRASDFFDEAEKNVKILRKKGYVSSENRFKTKLYQHEYGVVFPNTQTRESPKEGFLLWKDKQHADLNRVAENGKPGWHTECATMKAYFFGDYVDLHVGGIDLQFPHHENEIALGRVLFDKKDWIRYTLHTGHLEIDGKKMSKSEKNFVTLRDVMEHVSTPLVIRYLFLTHPYGKTMHFNKAQLKQAEKSYNVLISRLEELQQFSEQKDSLENWTEKPRWYELKAFKVDIGNCITDNLNIPEAIRLTETYMKTTLSEIKNKAWLRYCLNYVIYILDNYFGLLPHDTKERAIAVIPSIQEFRANIRKLALSQLVICDEFRKEMNKNGFITQDK